MDLILTLNCLVHDSCWPFAVGCLSKTGKLVEIRNIKMDKDKDKEKNNPKPNASHTQRTQYKTEIYTMIYARIEAEFYI